MKKLIQTAADVLGVPESTVRPRVMLLRKASLWSTAGKGVTAHPTPSDASNLLLSFLGGGLVTKTAETVRMVRASKCTRRGKAPPPLPPVNLFSQLDHGSTLGEVLDTLFDFLSSGASLRATETGAYVTQAWLSVERHHVGWKSELIFRDVDNDKIWRITYEVTARGVFGVFVGKAAAEAARQKAREHSGDMTSVTTATIVTFNALAGCVSPDWRFHSRDKHRVARTTRR